MTLRRPATADGVLSRALPSRQAAQKCPLDQYAGLLRCARNDKLTSASWQRVDPLVGAERFLGVKLMLQHREVGFRGILAFM